MGNRGPFNRVFTTNGGVIAGSDVFVGYNPSSSNNAACVADAGSLLHARLTLTVGYGSSARGNVLVVTNAGTVVASNLVVGTATDSQLIVDGGNVFVSNSISVPYGTVVVDSGLVEAATLNLTVGSAPKLAFNGGTVRARSTSGNNALFVVGDGSRSATFEMTAPSGVHTLPGGLVVSANATLDGSGTIRGSVTNLNGGSISPGPALAEIVITNHLVLDPGSVTIMELNASSGASDRISGMARVRYGGVLRIETVSGAPSDGQAFALFGAGNYEGAFSYIEPPTPGPGLRWDASTLALDGMLRVSPMPPPSPIVADATLAGGGVVISGANGEPYQPCVLLWSTNLMAPPEEWEPCLTNTFDFLGSVFFTNAIAPPDPVRFFRLERQ